MALGLFWSTLSLCVLISFLGVQGMRLFKRQNRFPVNGRTVVIIGGSRGMGKSAGVLLAKKGANILIVARNVDKLKEATRIISAAAPNPSTQRFHYISADLSIASEAARIMALATTWNGGSPPEIVWCCAGTCYPGLFIETPVEKLKAQMDSNYFSAAYMAHATLKAWLQPSEKSSAIGAPTSREPRHLIFTSSVVAFFPMIGYNPYSPSKCALRSLSDGLSQEMKLYSSSSTPISLHTIFPGTIYTDSYEAENLIKPDITKKLEENDPGQTADQAAATSIAGLENGEELITSGLLARAMRCSVMGNSKRNGLALLDVFLSWVVAALIMPIVQWDMNVKIRKWAKVNGTSGRLEK